MNTLRVGFIGLGVMGLPMATNLVRGGFEVTVHTRTASKADPALATGATWADTPAAAARDADVVITMLPDTNDVLSVSRGMDGLFSAAKDGLGWIDMSTISPMTARELAGEADELGIRAIDAPVSGGESGARLGTLTIMVGGPAEIVQSFVPILRVLGERIVHVGEAGAGQLVKACNQVIVGGTIALVAEALVLGARAGVEPVRLRDALLGGFAHSRVLEIHAERMLRGDFTPGFRVALHQKDLGIAMATARSVGASLPLTGVVSQLMNALVADGYEQLDHSALALVYEKLGAITLTPEG